MRSARRKRFAGAAGACERNSRIAHTNITDVIFVCGKTVDYPYLWASVFARSYLQGIFRVIPVRRFHNLCRSRLGQGHGTVFRKDILFKMYLDYNGTEDEFRLSVFPDGGQIDLTRGVERTADLGASGSFLLRKPCVIEIDCQCTVIH